MIRVVTKLSTLLVNAIKSPTTNEATFIFYGSKNRKRQFSPSLSSHLSVNWKIIVCENWSELECALKRNPQALIIHYNQIVNSKISIAEFLINIKSFIKLHTSRNNVRIAIAINRTTPLYLIKEAFGSASINNIIPCVIDFGIDAYINSMIAVWHHSYYCPNSIIRLLHENQTAHQTKQTTVTITLTPRQTEIAGIIASNGASNKQIAKVLGISESAVKFHLRKIFKKYNVVNRSQLTNNLLRLK